MKIDKITSYVNKGLNYFTGGTQMSSNSVKYDDFMQKLVDKIKSSEKKEIIEHFFELADKNELEKISANFFKYKDLHILNLFKCDGVPYSRNLERLTKMNLGITQKHVETIERGNDVYIITRIPGTQNGELVPLAQVGKKSVPKENRIKAFQDLQKLTKAGLVDDTVLQSHGMWFVNPENEIVIPVFDGLRDIRPDESRKEILEKYYHILFK